MLMENDNSILVDDRYVIVGIDATTGNLLVSPEMLRNYYNYAECVQLLQRLQVQMDGIRDFFMLPYSQALILIWQENILRDKLNDPTQIKTVIN